MRHTIDEAASLVGRTRRSIYRAMNEGRLSYGLEANGRRYIDTSELIRAYGEITLPSQSVHAEMSHGGMGRVTGAETWPGKPLGGPPRDEQSASNAALALGSLTAAVERLTAEVAALREQLAEAKQIEHKGEQLPLVQQERAARPSRRAQSFADLLEDIGD